jgi:hypothetical protein
MQVPLLDLKAQYSPIKTELESAIAEVWKSCSPNSSYWDPKSKNVRKPLLDIVAARTQSACHREAMRY